MPEPLANGGFILILNGKLVESTTGWPRSFPSREELELSLRGRIDAERFFAHRVPSVVVAQVVESMEGHTVPVTLP